jgi:hypothetical protein
MGVEGKGPVWPVAVLGWAFVALIGWRLLFGARGAGALQTLDVVMLGLALWVALTGTARWFRRRRRHPGDR